jgi:hypothetical protein
MCAAEPASDMVIMAELRLPADFVFSAAFFVFSEAPPVSMAIIANT